MNEEMNNQEVMENPELALTQEEAEELERTDGDWTPLEAGIVVAVTTLASIGTVAIGKKIVEVAKPGFKKAKDYIDAKVEIAKAKRAAKKEAKRNEDSETEVSEENEEK